MYRGGKICLDIHFAPLWAKYQPKLGIAHALAAALGPWLAAEIPVLADQGIIKPTSWDEHQFNRKWLDGIIKDY